MGTFSEKRSTWLFAACLLAAGICNIFTRTGSILVNTVMFCCNFMIETGLLVYWTQSLRERMLRTPARRRMIGIAALMIAYLLLRVCKYRVFGEEAVLIRYTGYAFYIPTALVPALFLMVCIRIRRSGRTGNVLREHLLLVSALVTAAVFMTNDSHRLVYRPYGDMESFTLKNGTYSYGPLFFVSWAVMGGTVAAGILILLQEARRSRKPQLKPLICVLALWAAVSAAVVLWDNWGIAQMYSTPECFIFGMLGVLETCVRTRMIPCNENHAGFFSRMSLPVMITDREFSPVYRTAKAVDASPEELRASLEDPVHPDPDTCLSGFPVRAGYAFYTEDETELHRLAEELREANEMISMENEVILREQELAEEKTSIEERGRLYRTAAQAIYPAQKRIDGLLETAVPDTPAFWPAVARALAVTAYVKRRANFCMLEAERDTILAEELSSALRESVHYLRMCGLDAYADLHIEADCPCAEAVALYDCFEAVAESLLGKERAVLVRLTGAELRITADGDEAPAPPELPLPADITCEDGQLAFRFRRGGAAG